MDHRRRTVIYDTFCEEQLDALRHDVKHLDGVLVGVDWALATNPEAWPLVDPKQFPLLRMMFTKGKGEIPALKVYYSVESDDVCRIHFIEHADAA
jgi:hypothetical protein